MKKNKVFKIISVIACLALALPLFAACSAHGAPEHSVTSPEFVAADMTDKLAATLDDFLGKNPDRTTNTVKEEAAANYLVEKLCAYGLTDAGVQDFTRTENKNDTVKGYNVVATYRSKGRTMENDVSTKNVVIGAYYDNRYSVAYEGATALSAEGALANGTGVAALMYIGEYLATQKPELDFDVRLVFFGASFRYDTGAQAYFDGMEPAVRRNTVLMVELQRLGCDHVYAFSDARKTEREPFFDRVAAENSLDIYKVTSKSPLIVNTHALDGIPFYQWAHTGVFAPFFNAGIPTLNIVGANWETVDMTDAESANYPNISYSSADTLTNLKERYPDYAYKMATAATLVIRSLEADDFLATMIADYENFPDTSVLNKDWIWSLVVLGVILIAAIVVYLVIAHLGKKYRPRPVQQKRVKMAVFGMDYEDKDAEHIYVDIKNSPVEEIFPGVPNNEIKPVDPFDGIFVSPDRRDDRPSTPQNETAQKPNDAPADEEKTDVAPADEETDKAGEGDDDGADTPSDEQ